MADPVVVPIVVSAAAVTYAIVQGVIAGLGPVAIHEYAGFESAVQLLTEEELVAMRVKQRDEKVDYQLDTETYSLDLRYYFHEAEFAGPHDAVPPISSMLF
jgi:hypothetical protein